jgi:hypothetical protein
LPRPLVRSLPHPAFKVDNLDRAVVNRKLLLGPYEPITGYRVAIIDGGGMPVELIETTLTDEEIWGRATNGKHTSIYGEGADLQTILRFLLQNFVSEYELMHLKKLASGEPFPFKKSDTFEKELRRLLSLGLIEDVRTRASGRCLVRATMCATTWKSQIAGNGTLASSRTLRRQVRTSATP